MDIKVKGIYHHFKGDYYIVEDVGINSETGEQCVIYRALYGDGTLFVRPYDNFMGDVDKIKYPKVEQKKRMELCNIVSVNKHL